MCAAAALYVFNVLRDCNNIIRNRNDKMLDKKVHHEEYSTFKKVFLYEIRIGWLLIGHLGREKEYVAIIISLTTPEGKCFYQTNRQHCHQMRRRIISGHLHPGGRYLEVDHSTPAWVEL